MKGMFDTKRLNENGWKRGRMTAAATAAAALLMCGLISGCDAPVTGGGFTGESKGYSGDVHTSEAELQANGEFLGKITYGKGIGDFGLTPLKYGSSPWDFSLIVENRNSVPAGAGITFVFKDAAGEVISAGQAKSRMLAPGAKDVVNAAFGDGDISDFASLEITATMRDGWKEGVYELVDPSTYREKASSATGSGRRIDISFNESHGDMATDFALFYDSDGNVYRSMWFLTQGKEAYIYATFPYSSYEIYAWNSTEEAGTVPEESLKEYEAAGFVTDRGTEYESLDHTVRYSFVDTADGHTLIKCSNLTGERRAFRKDGIVLLGGGSVDAGEFDWKDCEWSPETCRETKTWGKIGEERNSIYQLFLEPGQELYWDLGIPAGEDFYMLPFGTVVSEAEQPALPVVTVTKDGGSAKIAVTETGSGAQDVFRGELTVVFYDNGEIAGVKKLDLEDQGTHQAELEAAFDGAWDAAEAYLQYRYIQLPVEGV